MDFSDKCKRDGSIGLFREFAFLAAACAATVAPIAASAAEYEQGTTQEIVLMTGSADGTTNTLSEAIAAYNAAKGTDYSIDSFNGGDLAAYALVKEGDGTLVMDTEIANFTGPVVIKDGVIRCKCTGALGADVAGSHVYVEDGATFWVDRKAVTVVVNGKNQQLDSIFNTNRTLHVVGSGHNNQGALNSTKIRPQNAYNPEGIYGKELYLDGDATVVHPAWAFLANKVYLGAHTLTVNSGPTNATGCAYQESAYYNTTFKIGTLYGPGKLVADDSIYYLADVSLNDNGTEGNEFEVGNNSGFRFWTSRYSGYTWLFNFTGDVAWLWGDNNDGKFTFTKNGEHKANRIFNPMRLNGTTLKMRTQSGVYDNWVLLAGPISGNGNINLHYEKMAFPAGRLSLLNPGNSFVGTATVDKGVLYVYEPGSLPPEVPVVVSRSHALNANIQKPTWTLDYYGVEFVAPGLHSLSNLVFTSVADSGTYHPGRIQGGSGTFSRIDKQSPNLMEYYSGIGSPLLNVEGGTVKLPRGPAPGLWEGTNKTQNAGGQGSNGLWTFTSRATSTNLVARGPNLLNNTATAHFGAVPNNQLINVYDGYIWNRETTNVTWTFATSIAQYACVYVDGTEVVHYSYISDSSHVSPAHQFDQVTLTPGPHTFQVRACLSSIRYGGGWPTNFGFVYDKLGRYVDKEGPSDGNFAAISNNFEFVIDPGDGSLLTRSIDEADLPHFDEMRFADGTTLDVNGNAYVARTVSGYPHVTSTAEDPSAAPSLTISNQLVADAADLVAGKKLSLDIPLVFGASSSVNVTNLVGVSRRKYTLAEVTGEGNAVSLGDRLRLPCTVDNGKWVVMPSDDGKRLEFCPASGLMVSLR